MNEKKKGLMRMGGTITVSGPDLAGRLARGERVMFDEHHAELDLIVKEASKDSIVSFSPLVWIDEVDVAIHTDATDGDEVGGDLAIFIDGGGDRNVGLNVSIEQAEILVHILSNFISAYKGKEELDKTWEVKAA